MIERLLIANRGEIARRIMRTCRRLGTETVAVYSDADAGSAFVADADFAVGLGGEAPADSYLKIHAIIDAARRSGADAIHPGYGFLSENEDFARAVTDAGLIFVGPTPDAIAAMGSKLEAKRLMAEAGVPLLPSAELTGLSDGEIAERSATVGYPVLIKASAGGGGRGMRIVETSDDLVDAVTGAIREAESAFADGTVYAERYVAPSRHVEVQIFGDASGRVVHFGERECSIQRRHQKIIEEAPSPSLDDATRNALHLAAVKAGEAIGYTNAGTVEFLLAAVEGTRPEFFFLEVNTRLQVEHPVTEAVHDVDLVELQLAVAAGGAVPEQSDIGPPEGHAIEARLYAEDPTEDYRPSTGTVRRFEVPGTGEPGGVRVDSALDDEGEVSRFYDPMMAKVICHAPGREIAARRLASALAGTVVDGIATNRELLVRTLRHPDYLGDRGDSDFLIRNPAVELGRPLLEGDALQAAALAAALTAQSEHRRSDGHTAAVRSGFRNVATQPQRISFSLSGRPIEVDYRLGRDGSVVAAVDGVALPSPVVHGGSTEVVDLAVDGLRRRFRIRTTDASVAVIGPEGAAIFDRLPRFKPPEAEIVGGSTVATMPGTIVAVNVAPGDVVAAGDTLLVMEAMKMELAVAASTAGVVATVAVAAGDAVEAGAVLIVVDESADDEGDTGGER